jgi:fluoroquinolone transport system permease protein
MNSLTIWKTLTPIDIRSIGRDSLLRWIVILPLVVAVAARWLAPVLVANVERFLSFDLMPFYPAVMSYLLLLMVPYMAGFVIGFLLLDQRDDGTLTALQVTPLSLSD